MSHYDPLPHYFLNLTFAETQSLRCVQPFQTLMILPRGLRAAHGQVVFLSQNINTSLASLLPCPLAETGVLYVRQQKAKDSYTSYYCVRTHRIVQCVTHLHRYHVGIQHNEVTISDESIERFVSENDRFLESCSLPDEELESVSLQPLKAGVVIDVDARTLPSAFGSPLSWGTPGLEELAFPHLYPSGIHGWAWEGRTVSMSLREYVHCRMLSRDVRWQSDCLWPFVAGNMLAHMETNSRVGFVEKEIRAGHMAGVGGAGGGGDGRRKLRAGELKRELALGQSNLASKELSPSEFSRLVRVVTMVYRGTPAFWQKAKCNLYAMVSSLGAPQLFLTLSCNERCWHDMFVAIDREKYADWTVVEALSEQERLDVVSAYPSVVVEVFNRRVRRLISALKKAPSVLGGKLQHYFFRVEFQKRGAPHVHSLLWVDGVPRASDRDAFIEWVNRVVRARYPTEAEDPTGEMRELVELCQVHRHTFTCQTTAENKKQTQMRRAQQRARMADGAAVEENAFDGDDDDVAINADGDIMSDDGSPDGDQVQLCDGQRLRGQYALQWLRARCRFGFPKSLSAATHFITSAEIRFTVRADRDVVMQVLSERDRWVNNYAPFVLALWQSNMDLQVVVSVHACIAYILAYTTKNEPSQLDCVRRGLARLAEDATTRQVLRRIGNSVLSNRTVCCVEM